MADLKGSTLADFQEEAPKAQLVGDDDPDIVKHDPNTFAGLTAQKALKNMYAQGLSPTGDDIKGVYSKALEAANDYHRTLAQQAEAGNVELQKRQLALQSGLVGAEETTKAAIQQQKEQSQQQWAEGPSAEQAAAQQPGGVAAGKVAALSEQQQKELAAVSQGFNSLQRMHGLFDRMVQNTATSGGELKSGFGFLSPVGQATSLEARDYHSYVDFNLVGLAKALQGDSASGASKDTIQASMKEALPNDTDNAISGGHKIYNMIDGSYQKLLAMRNSVAGKQDTTNIDKTLVDMQSFMQQPQVQKYNALNAQNQPVVQLGNSQQAQSTIDNVNAGANAGLNPTQMAPTGYVSGPGTAAGGPAQLPPIGSAAPDLQQQHAQKAIQAHQLAQGIIGKIGQAVQTVGAWTQPFPTTATGEVAFPGQGQ